MTAHRRGYEHDLETLGETLAWFTRPLANRYDRQKAEPAVVALDTLTRTLEQETERATENGRLAQEHWDRAVAAEAKLAELQGELPDWEGEPWTHECRYQHNTECWGHGRAYRMAAKLAEQAAEIERLKGIEEAAHSLEAVYERAIDGEAHMGWAWQKPMRELRAALASPSSERGAA
jgi:hypothetical protein